MPSYRILIVDDQSEVRRVLRAALETLGLDLKIIEVPSGEEAILVVTRQPVDILIADIRLPGISGLELKDRARKRSPEMHLILITGMTDEDIRQKVARSGADAYFFKPIDIPVFLDTIQKLLGVKEPGPALTAELQVAKEEAPPHPLQTGELDRFLKKRLADLRHQSGALCMALLEDRGQVVAHSGDLSKHLKNPGLMDALVSFSRAAAGVASQLDGGAPYDFFSFFEPASIYCLTHIGYRIVLLSVLPGDEWGPERQWKLQRLMREAVLDFRQARPDWVAPLPASDEISSGIVDALPDPGQDNPALLTDLEAIFSQAYPGQHDQQEVDAFWESAVDQSADLPGGTDGISFEQARQMGLAPIDD